MAGLSLTNPERSSSNSRCTATISHPGHEVVQCCTFNFACHGKSSSLERGHARAVQSCAGGSGLPLASLILFVPSLSFACFAKCHVEHVQIVSVELAGQMAAVSTCRPCPKHAMAAQNPRRFPIRFHQVLHCHSWNDLDIPYRPCLKHLRKWSRIEHMDVHATASHLKR